MSRAAPVPPYQVMDLDQVKAYAAALEDLYDNAHAREQDLMGLWVRRFECMPESHRVDLFLDVQQLKDERSVWFGIRQAVAKELGGAERRLWDLEDELEADADRECQGVARG